MSLLEKIKNSEGFRSRPYKCSRGVWTFGHGLTYITEEESEQLVKNRIESLTFQIDNLLRSEEISIDDTRKEVLIEMAYQLGVKGLSKFYRMLKALKDMDYDTAADEMLNSLWARQTPQRCKRLSEVMRNGL